MSVRSMTGFARVRREIPQGELVFSLKSVNHRGLDLHFHMPNELDALENDVRAVIKTGVARGHLQIHCGITRTAAAGAAPLNRTLLTAYLAAFREAADIYKVAGNPDLNSALRIPGMLTTGDEEELGEDVAKALLAAAADAVAALNKVREREGAATAEEMRQRCRSICSLVVRMEEIRAGAVGIFQKRLREKLADLLHGAGIEPQRLAQEAAILADRSDISE
ncbi:MAG TPA: YicC/YloC family endoribonuclease, partial [Candidatus Solibacter sp.]